MVAHQGYKHASPHVCWHDLVLPAVEINGGFWEDKQDINHRASLAHGYQMLEESGALSNLRLAADRLEGEHQGMRFQDSDVYKWLEAAAYELAKASDAELQEQVDSTIALVAAAQEEDGYLNTYYQISQGLANRWTKVDHDHELYCAGHLIEAAVAHYRATGEESLLNVARRFVDHIDSVFGKGKREEAPGHEEIELALIEMYRATGEKRYLDLAEFFLNERGKNTMQGWQYFSPAYYQDRVPVRDYDTLEGHAVRALYLTTGIADLYMETGEQALLDALHRQWNDLVSHKLYITGSVGARPYDEAFGKPYELPDEGGYCETCAAIASIMWNWRMLLITGEAQYADLIERTLYNGFLSGVSLDGKSFFYDNPLLVQESFERQSWFKCACCPPNVMRLIASFNRYMITVSAGELQIHQYATADITADIPDAGTIKLKMVTDYPWDGQITITLDEVGGSDWQLRLRIPEWCDGAQVLLNGAPVDAEAKPGYVVLAHRWQAGDVITLNLPMEPRLLEAHPRVAAIRGSLAVERGPLVYCLEAADQADGVDLRNVQLDPNTALSVEHQAELLGGTVVVAGHGFIPDMQPWQNRLYLARSQASLFTRQPVALHFIPYAQWANRNPGPMRVWVPKG